MSRTSQRGRANARLGRNLGLFAVAMFGFGFALWPLYNVLCEITGLNGKTGRLEQPAAAESPVDRSRLVTVEFTGHASTGLPWEFVPRVKKLDVHPGEVMEVMYYARNLADEPVTGQAVPSVAPGRAAAHFNKIECFCFTQQQLKPGEGREMPVRFVVDAKLPREVHTITLNYAFFNLDKTQARRYGGEALAQGAAHGDHQAHPATPGG